MSHNHLEVLLKNMRQNYTASDRSVPFYSDPKIGLRIHTAIDTDTMTQFEKTDQRFMRAALIEAKKGLGLTSPNPAVGAVLVLRNRIVARGHHRQAGGPHGDTWCLANCGRPCCATATLLIS